MGDRSAVKLVRAPDGATVTIDGDGRVSGMDEPGSYWFVVGEDVEVVHLDEVPTEQRMALVGLEVNDLPPVPDGHRRVVLVKARMAQKAFHAYAEFISERIKPDLILNVHPDEDVEIVDEPFEVDEAEALRRCERVGMRNPRIVERQDGTCVIGYDDGPPEEAAYHMLQGTKIAGVETALRRRRG